MEILNFFSSQIASTIGWTIIHSLWQGLLVSLLLAVILMFIDKKNSHLRSTVSYFALIFLFTISMRTYLELDKNQRKNLQIATSDTSIISRDLIEEKNEVLMTSNTSGLKKSKILEYTFFFKDFISTHINYIVLLWFAGIIILSLRLLGGIFYTQRLKLREVKRVNNYWEEQIENLSLRFGITKRVKLFQSKLVKFPITIGYFKPVILLPIGLISGIPHNQLEIILAHELAHIKRADYILNIFQSIIEVLFFFNPTVWWISKTIRTEREFLCDDLAIETCGNSVTLAKALFFVQNSDYNKSKIAMAAIGNKNSLMGRIKRMKHSKSENKIFSATLTIIPMLLLVTLLACSQLNSEIVRDGAPSARSSEVTSVSYANFSVGSTPYSFTSSESASAQHSERGAVTTKSTLANVAKIRSSIIANIMDDDNRIKITFHEDDIYWKAYFEDDKLVELYRDGEKVAESDFSNYEDFLNERYEDFKEDMANLEVDMDQLKIELADLKVDLSELKDIEINFDKEEFAREMKEMKHELKEGLAELKNMDFDFDIDIDFDELNENLKNIKIDLSGLDVDMANLDIELTELKEELKLLKYFLNDLRSELVEDGYIKDEDEDFELVLSKNKMIVNDERVPDKTHQKYLKLYKEHYGEDIDEDFRISN